MKRCLLSISTILFVIMSVVAQPRLSSNKETHIFGQIEWKHPVSTEYTITNTGNKPLVMSNVTTSCACSVADWTKTPIAPGAKGTVKVTFDAKALGRFDKEVAIYSNAQPSLVYLHFTGEVVQEVKDFSNTHTALIGQIGIDCTEFNFPNVQWGEEPSITFSIVNLSDRPYEPVLMHLPPYLSVERTPDVVLKGKKGTLKLTLDSKQLKDYGLTQTSVYLARFSGDKVSEENEIPVSVILLPDFSGLSERDLANAPSINLSATDIDFSEQLAKKNKASENIVVTNTGKSPLQISKLQVFNSAVGVDLKKALLQPGESTRLRVTIQKKESGNKKRQLRILMITNDPKQAKVEINIKR